MTANKVYEISPYMDEACKWDGGQASRVNMAFATEIAWLALEKGVLAEATDVSAACGKVWFHEVDFSSVGADRPNGGPGILVECSEDFLAAIRRIPGFRSDRKFDSTLTFSAYYPTRRSVRLQRQCAIAAAAAALPISGARAVEQIQP